MSVQLQLQQVQAQLNQLASTLSNVNRAASQANPRGGSTNVGGSTRTVDINKELTKFTNELMKGRENISKEQLKSIEDLRTLKARELNLLQERLNAIEKLAEAEASGDKALRAKHADALKEIDAKRVDLIKQLDDGTAKLTHEFDTNTSRLAKIGVALTGAAKLMDIGHEILKKNYRANVGVFEGGSVATALLNQKILAFRLGISQEALAKFTNQNRYAIDSVGGTANAFNEFSGVLQKNRILYGDFEEASKVTFSSINMLAKSGIRPTADSVDALSNAINRQVRYYGGSLEAATAAQAEMLNSASSMKAMRNLSEKERLTHVKGILSAQELYQTMGLLDEQTKGAIESLNEMAGNRSPVKRLQDSIRLQQLVNVMGLGKDVDIQNLIKYARTGGKGMTDEQIKSAALGQTKMGAAADKAHQSGNFGQEQLIYTLMENLPQNISKGMYDASNTLAKSTEKDRNKANEGKVSTTDASNSGLGKTIMLGDKIKNAVDEMKTAADIMLTAAITMTGSSLLGLLKDLGAKKWFDGWRDKRANRSIAKDRLKRMRESAAERAKLNRVRPPPHHWLNKVPAPMRTAMEWAGDKYNKVTALGSRIGGSIEAAFPRIASMAEPAMGVVGKVMSKVAKPLMLYDTYKDTKELVGGFKDGNVPKFSMWDLLSPVNTGYHVGRQIYNNVLPESVSAHMADGVGGLVESIGSLFDDPAKHIKDTLSDWGTNLSYMSRQIADSQVIQGVSKWKDSVIDTTKNWAAHVSNTVTSTIAQAKAAYQSTIQFASTIIYRAKDLSTSVSDVFSNLMTTVSQALQNIRNYISQLFDTYASWDGIKSIITGDNAPNAQIKNTPDRSPPPTQPTPTNAPTTVTSPEQKQKEDERKLQLAKQQADHTKAMVDQQGQGTEYLRQLVEFFTLQDNKKRPFPQPGGSPQPVPTR